MKKQPNKKEFARIIAETDILGMEGLLPKAYCKSYNLNLTNSKKNLLLGYNEFEACCKWLDECVINKTANQDSLSSYRLKHMVEKDHKSYISNGALIAAVIFLDIPYVEHPDESPNISVGISKRSPRYKALINNVY